MKELILAIGIAMALPVQASDETVTGEEVRDQIIDMISDNDRDEHTCRRAREMGEGIVSDEECVERLKNANALCLNIAKESVPRVLVERDSKLLVEVLMVCPIAKVLDIGFYIVNGKVHVQWGELDAKKEKR